MTGLIVQVKSMYNRVGWRTKPTFHKCKGTQSNAEILFLVIAKTNLRIAFMIMDPQLPMHLT